MIIVAPFVPVGTGTEAQLPSPCAQSQGPDYAVVQLWILDSASRSAPQNDRGECIPQNDRGECALQNDRGECALQNDRGGVCSAE